MIDAEQATDEPHSAPKNIRVRPQRTRPIRESSSVGQARRVLRIAHGGPLHIDEVIKLIRQMTGLSVNKQTLVSNLSRYVNAGDTFVRTAPNTYALKREREDLILAG